MSHLLTLFLSSKESLPSLFYFILFCLFYFGLSSIVFPSRRESGRAELKCLILDQDQGSQFRAGVGATGMAEQQPHHKEGLVRLTGKDGENWISGSPLTTSTFCF